MIFDRLHKGLLSLPELPADGKFIATHIQLDEIKAIRDPENRARTEAIFTEIVSSSVPTESCVWDISDWDQAKWSSDDTWEQIRDALDQLQSHPNNQKDALIAEVALKSGYTLVIDGRNLHLVCRQFSCDSILLREHLTAQREPAT
jgi:hypothetical protein